MCPQRPVKNILVLILFSLLSLASHAEPLRILNFELDSQIKFSKPTELSADATSLTYPRQAKYAEAQLELIVHRYSAKAVKTMTEAGVPLGKTARVNFLGLSGQAKEINKTLFMGRTAARRVYQASVPRSHQVHVFQKIAEDGSFVTVAARVFQKNDATGPLLRSIANTFKVSKECELCK